MQFLCAIIWTQEVWGVQFLNFYQQLRLEKIHNLEILSFFKSNLEKFVFSKNHGKILRFFLKSWRNFRQILAEPCWIKVDFLISGNSQMLKLKQIIEKDTYVFLSNKTYQQHIYIHVLYIREPNLIFYVNQNSCYILEKRNTTLQIITALKKNGCKNNHISEFIKVQLSKLLKHILHQMKKIHFCDFLKLSHKLKFSNSSNSLEDWKLCQKQEHHKLLEKFQVKPLPQPSPYCKC